MSTSFLHGDIIVKRFGDKIKLTCLKSSRSPALPSLDPSHALPAQFKRDNNLSRTRGAVYELAACNPWQYFATLTLDAARRDRFDLSAFRRDFAQWLRNYNRLHGAAVKYLLIPEQHKDGAWHMHGLLSGLEDGRLVRNRFGYLDWLDYAKRFGFISLSEIRSQERVSSYITKYITKDMSARLHELGAHLYYASKGLKRAEPLGVYRLKGRAEPEWDFESDWVKVKWVTPEEFDEAAQMMYAKSDELSDLGLTTGEAE